MLFVLMAERVLPFFEGLSLLPNVLYDSMVERFFAPAAGLGWRFSAEIRMQATTEKLKLVLASSSPRRRQLMSEAGYRFEPVDPPIDEPSDVGPGLSVARRAEALAYFKARSVAEVVPQALILGADTMVATAGASGEVLGKPSGPVDAERMLRQLSGTRHQVITGVALLGPEGCRRIDAEVTYVTMREMTEGEIRGYIESGEWEGKAGAYAIQETADRFVVRVEGSFSNVIGLPMEMVGHLLSESRACMEGPGEV